MAKYGHPMYRTSTLPDCEGNWRVMVDILGGVRQFEVGERGEITTTSDSKLPLEEYLGRSVTPAESGYAWAMAVKEAGLPKEDGIAFLMASKGLAVTVLEHEMRRYMETVFDLLDEFPDGTTPYKGYFLDNGERLE